MTTLFQVSKYDMYDSGGLYVHNVWQLMYTDCGVNSHYPRKLLKHRCKVEDQKVVHECSSIILVEQALLRTF